jgi:hypothetical protein
VDLSKEDEGDQHAPPPARALLFRSGECRRDSNACLCLIADGFDHGLRIVRTNSLKYDADDAVYVAGIGRPDYETAEAGNVELFSMRRVF